MEVKIDSLDSKEMKKLIHAIYGVTEITVQNVMELLVLANKVCLLVCWVVGLLFFGVVCLPIRFVRSFVVRSIVAALCDWISFVSCLVGLFVILFLMFVRIHHS